MEEESNDGHRPADTQTNGGPAEGASDGAGANGAPAPDETTSGAGTPAGTSGIGYATCVTTSSGWLATVPFGTVATHVHSMGPPPVVAYRPIQQLETLPPEVGEIVAWRAWRIIQTSAGLRLMSVTQKSMWEPGEPMVGKPSANSLEGIYASKTRAMIENSPYATYSIIGEVALWGEVVEHENGYRAQYAKPLTLEFLSIMPAIFDPSIRHGLWFPDNDSVIRSLNELRRTYGLPHDKDPPKWHIKWRDIMHAAFLSVIVVGAICWAKVAGDLVLWLTITPAQ